MFEKILIAVPMEQYPEMAIMRAKEIIGYWNSEIVVAYVIEDNILDVASDHSQYILTKEDEQEWQKKIIHVHENRAREIVVSDIEAVIGKKIDHFNIMRGMYSEVIIRLLKKYPCDLIILEKFPQSFIQLRILDSSPVNLWIEHTAKSIRRIGLFCTNANPNILTPPIAGEIAEKYSASLFSYFIFDPSFPMTGTIPDEISKNHGLLWEGILKGKVIDTIIRIVKEKNLDFIILGRVKPYRLSSLFGTILSKVSCNVLFVR